MTALCLRYTDFIYLSESELLEIIKQRNSDYVRRFMDNARIISAEEHLRVRGVLELLPQSQ